MTELHYFKPSDTVVSALNVRSKKNVRDIDSLVSDIKINQQIQPVIVRYENDIPAVIVGQRRRQAFLCLEKENPEITIAAIVMELSDKDAIALSLSENAKRADMTIVDYWKAFKSLGQSGWGINDIAELYDLSTIKIRQIMKLSELPASVLNLYEKGEIYDSVIQTLTMASKAKIKEWVALYKEGNAITNPHHLRQLLMGGDTLIDTNAALFDVKESKIPTIEDLFQGCEYFADNDAFWIEQNNMIDAEIGKLEKTGWPIIRLDSGFYSWEWVKRSKADGGAVCVDVSENGEVEFHKGYISETTARKEAKKQSGSAESATVTKSEITDRMDRYLAGYKTVRARHALQDNYDLTQRILLCQLIADDGGIRFDLSALLEQYSDELTQDQLTSGTHYVSCDTFINTQLEPLSDSYSPHSYQYASFEDVFEVVSKMSIYDVQAALTAVSMASITPTSAAVGVINGEPGSLAMSEYWSPERDDAFFSLVNGKALITAIYTDTVGTEKASEPQFAKAKVASMREQLADAAKTAKKWLPKYFLGKRYLSDDNA